MVRAVGPAPAVPPSAPRHGLQGNYRRFHREPFVCLLTVVVPIDAFAAEAKILDVQRPDGVEWVQRSIRLVDIRNDLVPSQQFS